VNTAYYQINVKKIRKAELIILIKKIQLILLYGKLAKEKMMYVLILLLEKVVQDGI
jgi:hypothetical protein